MFTRVSQEAGRILKKTVYQHRLFNLSVAKAAEAKMTTWESLSQKIATENIASKLKMIVKWI
jgi:hypothetical protein